MGKTALQRRADLLNKYSKQIIECLNKCLIDEPIKIKGLKFSYEWNYQHTGYDVFANFDFSNKSSINRDFPTQFFFDGSLRDLQNSIGDRAYFLNVGIDRLVGVDIKDVPSARNFIKDIEKEKQFFEKLTIAFCGLPYSSIKRELIEQAPERTDADLTFHKPKSQGR